MPPPPPPYTHTTTTTTDIVHFLWKASLMKGMHAITPSPGTQPIANAS